MTQKFKSVSVTATSPAASFKSITPNDTTNLPDGICRAIHIGVAGNIAVIGAHDDASVVIKGLTAGSTKVGFFKRVLATGTTATDLVAEY